MSLIKTTDFTWMMEYLDRRNQTDLGGKKKKKRNDFGLYLESELMTAKYLGQGAIDTVGLYRE